MMLVDRLALALNTSNHERDALRAKIAEMEHVAELLEWVERMKSLGGTVKVEVM